MGSRTVEHESLPRETPFVSKTGVSHVLEVARDLLRTPVMVLPLPMKEPDRQADEATERIHAGDRQTLRNGLADIVDIPEIEVDTGAALSGQVARRFHDRVQQ